MRACSRRALLLGAALAVLLLLEAAPASALTCEWGGMQGVSWTASSTNWECGTTDVVPDGDDDVVLDGGNDSVLVDGNVSANKVTILNFARMTMSGEPTITVGAGGFTVTTGTVGGPGTMNVAGPFLHASGALTIGDDADVVLAGDATFSGGTLALDDGAGPGGDPSVRFDGALDLSASDGFEQVVNGEGLAAGSRPFRIGATGSLSRTSSGSATINVESESAGSITIAASQEIRFGFDLLQTAGTTNVQGGGTLSGRIIVQGGLLTGAGAVWAAHVSGGSLSPATGSALTVGGMIQTAGQTTVASGETLDINVSGAGQDGGATTVAPGGTLRVGASRSWILNGGTLNANGLVDGQVFMNGTGVLSGGGTIQGKLTNFQGTIAPGNSAGTLTLGNDLELGGTDTVVIAVEIGGTTPGSEFDRLAVAGLADLGGKVEVTFLNGFVPPGGSNYHFLTSGSRSGTFQTLTGGGTLTLNYPGSPSFGARLTAGQAPVPPSNTAPPQVSGTPEPGQTLTCQPGMWTGNPTFTYAWLLDGSPIGSATASTYVVAPQDAGHQLSCRVTAANAGGSTPATSAAVTVAAPANPNPVPPGPPDAQPAFGADTLVTLRLAADRIPAAAPLPLLVANANAFPIAGEVGGETRNAIAAQRGRQRVRLTPKAFSLAPGARTIVKLKLPKKLRRVLKRKRRLALRLRATVSDPAGNSRSVSRTVTVRLKSSGKRGR